MGISGNEAIELFTRNILETRFEDIDPTVIEQAKTRIIDTIGCLIGGAEDPGNPEFVRLLSDQGGAPEATVFLYGHKVPVAAAAMANCILCRSFDYEPVSPVVDGKLTPAHISGTTIMTALCMAQYKGSGGREMLTAMLVGEDMVARVLATSGFSINLGWDGNGTANAFGATAIAGRMSGFTPQQLRHAFGLVVSQMGGSMQNIWDGTPAFKLPQGLSARNGIFAAQLAAAGWTGPKDALLGPNGYYALYTKGITDPDLLTKDLGVRYYSDRAIKPYPSCRATHDAIDCALGLRQDYKLNPGDVQEVIIYQSGHNLRNFCAKPLILDDFPHSQLAFSYQYTVAAALFFGRVVPEHFTKSTIGRPDVVEFVEKVRLSPWSQVESADMGIKVILKDGTEIVAPYRGARGDFLDDPLSDEELIAKYMGNVVFSNRLTMDAAERLRLLVRKLETLDRLDEIFQILDGRKP